MTQSLFVGLARPVYIHTVHDHTLGDFPAKFTVYTPYVHMVLSNPMYLQLCFGNVWRVIVFCLARYPSFLQGRHERAHSPLASLFTQPN